MDKGGYTDTTISDGTDMRLVRIDMTPGVTTTDVMQSVQPEVGALRAQAGYSEIDLSPDTFEGNPAVHWEFLVRESGVLLHKEDEVFIDGSGNEFAILTEAPANEYAADAGAFDAVRNSFADAAP